MSWKNKTVIFLLVSISVFALSVIIYDVFAISKGGTEASISFVVYEMSFKYPFFTFSSGLVFGILIGHFFWRIRDTKRTKEISDFSRGE